MASKELQPYFNHNRTVLAELEEGDLIEFERGIYSHWAVYCGDERVIHLAGDQDAVKQNCNSGSVFTICGRSFDKAEVKLDKFWDVVSDSKAKKNNSKDQTRRPLRRTEIIKKAKGMLGKIDYNVLWNNCEHFATYCRYGFGESEQTDNVLTGVGLLAFAAIGYGAYRFVRNRRNN